MRLVSLILLVVLQCLPVQAGVRSVAKTVCDTGTHRAVSVASHTTRRGQARQVAKTVSVVR
jgi:hypothetical protein